MKKPTLMELHEAHEELAALLDQYEAAEFARQSACSALDVLAERIVEFENYITHMENTNGKLSEARAVPELRLTG